MTINYSLLGTSKKVQARRYKVLSLMVKAATPTEIQSILQLPFKTIENDVRYIHTHPLHLLSAKTAKDFSNSEYELKLRELERVAQSLDLETNLKEWLSLQEIIRKYHMDSNKLQGLMNEKVEHEFTTPIQITWPKPP